MTGLFVLDSGLAAERYTRIACRDLRAVPTDTLIFRAFHKLIGL